MRLAIFGIQLTEINSASPRLVQSDPLRKEFAKFFNCSENLKRTVNSARAANTSQGRLVSDWQRGCVVHAARSSGFRGDSVTS
jgi:hypothetical protein